MPRNLWGEFNEDDKQASNEDKKIVPVSAKRLKLSEVQNQLALEVNKNVTVKVKNPLVTQTIEVMKQTEMLQSLIDTYSNKSGTSNYLLNPSQMIPEVNFPPENAADFVSDEKFTKPIWFMPPQDTDFAKGVPQHYPQVTSEVCRASLRKAVCGQMRVAGFTDTAESALILFADACEEFIINLMQHIREVHSHDPKLETQRDIEVPSVEKAYFAMTNTSLTQVHNYFKHHLIARNRTEISEFNGVFQEYDKLMKESQGMQKLEEGEFMNMFEMPAAPEGGNMPMQDFSNAGGVAVVPSAVLAGNANTIHQTNVMGLIEGQHQVTMQPESLANQTAEVHTYTADVAGQSFQAHDQ